MYYGSLDGFLLYILNEDDEILEKNLLLFKQLNASKDLERTSRMRYVFRTCCSCSFNLL